MCTESKWFSSIVMQMKKFIKDTSNYRFQFKLEDDNLYNRIKEQTSCYNNNIFNFPQDMSIIEEYFNFEKIEENEVLDTNYENDLCNNLKVFDLHEYYDTMTFTEEFLQNLNFIKVFEYFSKGKAFTSVCRYI